MPKSMSFAIATQQAHATGHTPKGYGTAQGKRTAKRKYDEPKSEYKQTADPSHKSKTSSLSLAFWKGFTDELQKIAAATGLSDVTKSITRKSGLVATPKQTSIPREPTPPAPVKDLLSSAKTIQPPPVTAGSM